MAAGAVHGSPIVTVQFLGVAPGTPVDGASHYVTPYEVSIDGGNTISVTCYDLSDSVFQPYTWQARELTIADAAVDGFFATSPDPSIGLAKYTEVAFLSGQGYSDTEHEIALQHAIWSVFGTPAQVATLEANDTANELLYEGQYLNLAATAAGTGYAAYDLSGFRFLEQVGGDPGSQNPATEQAFVFGVIVPKTTNTFDAPEPGTSVMIAGGLFCLLASFGFKRLSAKRG